MVRRGIMKADDLGHKRSTHLRRLLGFGAVFAFGALEAAASLPSVQFDALAREAECIFVAEYVPSQAKQGTAQSSRRSHAFVTIGQAGTLCDAASATVFVRTEEVPSELAQGIYLVFLKRRGPDAFSYANEPFGHLRVKDGLVDTLPFFELGRGKVPLDELLSRIRIDRNRSR